MAAPNPQLPVVARLHVRYAKRDRLRFASHRDFARSLERAVRAARLPIAYSSGFSPHPRISYAGAAPTGAASEAEYLELALHRPVDPDDVKNALNATLPEGFAVLEVGVADGSIAEKIDGSHWQLDVPADPAQVGQATAAFLARDEVLVERRTKDGVRQLDARPPVVRLAVRSESAPGARYAIIDLVIRHVTPAVRPDDVLTALREVGGLAPAAPPRATRLAQGRLDESGRLADPLQTFGPSRDDGTQRQRADTDEAPTGAASSLRGD